MTEMAVKVFPKPTLSAKLVEDGQSRIALEVIEFVPNLRTLEACRLVGQHILRDVLQELIEDII